jgi:hypothetical protein
MTAALSAQLHEQAVAAVGFDDFGDGSYEEALDRLLEALEVAPGRSETLTMAARDLALGPLVGRLWSQAGWQGRPDCLRARLPAPVFIVGIPRTGTTLLHKLLSLDARFQVLQNWILPNPMVRPDRDQWDEFEPFRAAWVRFDQAPETIRRTHLVRPDEADECLSMMAQSFVSNLFGSRAWVPDYDKWFLAQDMTPSFARLADNLRLIGADEADRPWLLKNPSHVLALPELFAVFPDARIVQTHRDPQVAIGSVVSLLTKLSGQDPRPRAAREVALWGEGMRRTTMARRNSEHRFYDIFYDELVADPVRVCENLLGWLGLDLEERTRDRMVRWLSENPQGQHGEHRYEPAELGVTQAAVEEHFGEYATRHRSA